MSVPWPIVGVESRGDTVVRVRQADSTVADRDFSYLLGGAGVFARLTEEMIPEAGICGGGTVGWETDAGVIDLGPDALREHAALGLCPGNVCRGWTHEHTVLVQRGG